jgi:dihydrofolate reductase
VFSFVNQLERKVGTYLFGRRMYETMNYWENASTLPNQTTVENEYADLWKAIDKIVYSTTLTTVTSAKTQIRRQFNLDEIATLKQTASLDVAIAGADLASQALTAGLVDEVHLFVTPTVLGTGKRAFAISTHLPLRLLEERRFDCGVAYLRFDCAN